jgi:hypothetical protein
MGALLLNQEVLPSHTGPQTVYTGCCVDALPQSFLHMPGENHYARKGHFIESYFHSLFTQFLRSVVMTGDVKSS